MPEISRIVLAAADEVLRLRLAGDDRAADALQAAMRNFIEQMEREHVPE